jgi:hypothetical protein
VTILALRVYSPTKLKEAVAEPSQNAENVQVAVAIAAVAVPEALLRTTLTAPYHLVLKSLHH